MMDEFLTTARSSPLVRAPHLPSPPSINHPKSTGGNSVPNVTTEGKKRDGLSSVLINGPELILKKKSSIAFSVVLECSCDSIKSQSRKIQDLSILTGSDQEQTQVSSAFCQCLALHSSINLPPNKTLSSSLNDLPSLSIKTCKKRRSINCKSIQHHAPTRKKLYHKKRHLRRSTSIKMSDDGKAKICSIFTCPAEKLHERSAGVRFKDHMSSLETLVDDSQPCWTCPIQSKEPISPSSSVAATVTSPIGSKPEDETSTTPLSSPVDPIPPYPSPRSPTVQSISADTDIPPSPATREDLLPPITRYTLRELDISEIVNNAQLRHDLLFDPDMQFRPNLDGDRGAIKQKKAERYWTHVRNEIEGRRMVRSPKIKGNLDQVANGSLRAHASTESTVAWTRVPLLIKEMKEILLELVPGTPGFESSIHNYLDVPLLLQQLSHHALTPVPIIAFITSHLHQYCAPCRDDLVSDVLSLFKFGHYTAGLRKLLSVLELMKLDFANHHLRKLRPWIVENAEEFEWKGFRDRWVTGEVAGRTVSWLERSMRGKGKEDSAKAIYNQALMSLITSPDIVSTDASNLIPETFSLDFSRLTSFHNDWQDISIVCTLLLIFRQVTGSACTSADVSEMKRVLWILLNDSDTMMTNVTLQLASNASKIRGKEFSAKETTLLNGLVDKTLSFENKMYDLVQTHVAARILHVLNTGRMETKEQLERFGLRELEEELRELTERVAALANHNRRTYRILYDAVFDRWRKSDSSVGKGLKIERRKSSRHATRAQS